MQANTSTRGFDSFTAVPLAIALVTPMKEDAGLGSVQALVFAQRKKEEAVIKEACIPCRLQHCRLKDVGD